MFPLLIFPFSFRQKCVRVAGSSVVFLNISVLLCTLWVGLAFPFFSYAENVERFFADITIEKDGSFLVTETIDYAFSDKRHGIFREIPLIHPESSYAFWRERIIEIELDRVRVDGADIPFTLEPSKKTFKVYIGNPVETVEGRHTYTLEYRVYGGLSYPVGQGTELYWNVTGNTWSVPIDFVGAALNDPFGLFSSSRACYRGTFGSTDGSCLVNTRATGTVEFSTTRLLPGEGMTIAQSLDTTKVSKDIRERVDWRWLYIPFSIFILIFSGVRAYRWKTAHKTGHPIIPQYEPYPGIKPMYTGLLFDGNLDPRDITACIIYLAVEGYIHIQKIEKKVLFVFEVDDYRMTLTRLPDDGLGSFEASVLSIFFQEPLSQGKSITLSDLKYKSDLHRENVSELEKLSSSLDDDMKRTGYFEYMSVFQKCVLAIFGLCSAVLLFAPTPNESIHMFGFFLSIMVIVFIIILLRRRTKIGYEILDYLKGFKLFLETTERDRYIFHDAPDKTPDQFMEYLPYAIAFGVENEWAKVFEGMMIPNPSWYDNGGGAFSTSSLTASLGAFSSSFASSSGTSGSSGGGSSGGGAGGGGGGSW